MSKGEPRRDASLADSGVNLESYAPTGIRGVDELLEGKGIPRGYIVFALGGPGSGKTTFGLQFLYNGISRYGESGVYVSLDEDVSVIRKNVRSFGWDLDELEKQNKLSLIDSAPIRLVPATVQIGGLSLGKRDFQMLSLIDVIKKRAKEIGAKRLVVDPLATLVLQYPDHAERRYAVMDLMQGIASTGCTTLLISELNESSLERAYQFEEYLAQGVVMMRKISRTGGVVRAFSIEKMRGVDHDHQPRPYKISSQGIEVYTTEIVL